MQSTYNQHSVVVRRSVNNNYGEPQNLIVDNPISDQFIYNSAMNYSAKTQKLLSINLRNIKLVNNNNQSHNADLRSITITIPDYPENKNINWEKIKDMMVKDNNIPSDEFYKFMYNFLLDQYKRVLENKYDLLVIVESLLAFLLVYKNYAYLYLEKFYSIINFGDNQRMIIQTNLNQYKDYFINCTVDNSSKKSESSLSVAENYTDTRDIGVSSVHDCLRQPPSLKTLIQTYIEPFTKLLKILDKISTSSTMNITHSRIGNVKIRNNGLQEAFTMVLEKPMFLPIGIRVVKSSNYYNYLNPPEYITQTIIETLKRLLKYVSSNDRNDSNLTTNYDDDITNHLVNSIYNTFTIAKMRTMRGLNYLDPARSEVALNVNDVDINDGHGLIFTFIDQIHLLESKNMWQLKAYPLFSKNKNFSDEEINIIQFYNKNIEKDRALQ